MNWLLLLRNLGVFNALVISLDDHAHEALRKLKLPTLRHPRSMDAKMDFRARVELKLWVVLRLVELGFDTFFSDADVAFYRDPIPYMSMFPDADLLISSDLLITSAKVVDTCPYPDKPQCMGLEDHFEFRTDKATARHYMNYAQLNVGMKFIRSNPRSIQFLRDWNARTHLALIHKGNTLQGVINVMLRSEEPSGTCTLHSDGVLARCYNGTLLTGLLPVAQFSGCHTFFVQRMQEKLNVAPIALHMTYMAMGGKTNEGKKHRLRDVGKWIDRPDYYNPERNFLTFDLKLPEWVLDKNFVLPELRNGRKPKNGGADKPEMVRLHFELAHTQLRQLRFAIHAARKLNRILVLPKVWCLFDATWYGMDGCFPGLCVRGPQVCTIDSYVDLKQLVHMMGGETGFRESVFFDHPHYPGHAGNAVARLDEETLVSEDFLNGRGPFAAGAEASPASARILHLTEVTARVASRVPLPGDTAFEDELKKLALIWCCVSLSTARDMGLKFPPGHIHYDFLYDRAHTDRFGRTFEETWLPVTGP